MPSTRDEDALGPNAGLSCATLAGDVVVNRQRDELGSVRHLMIDVAAGRVAYAMLGVGGVFGIGEALLPIPWNALALDRDALVLDIERDKLERAPRFEGGRGPSLADPDWAREIRDFYGVDAL
ncbi:MAG: PRC-barrel domain-containing protein [Usitatibacter sp.]